MVLKAYKGYRSISVHTEFSTVDVLSKSGRPAKMSARAQLRMLSDVKKIPKVSAKDLQKTLNKNSIHGRTPRRKPKLSKKIAAQVCKTHLNIPQGYTGKIFWVQIKPKLSFLERTHIAVHGEKMHCIPTPHSNSKV